MGYFVGEGMDCCVMIQGLRRGLGWTVTHVEVERLLVVGYRLLATGFGV